jgi:uncharacterized protein
LICSSRTIARTERGRPRGLAFAAPLGLFLAAALTITPPAWSREWPEPRGHLSDFAGIVDAASADTIEALARELRAKTGAELAVVTLQDLGGETIDPVAVELFQAWGIGGKGRDDGVLILLAQAERRVRIEVGYGLEGILPDGRCGAIIRRVMGPDLSADRFGPGLLRGAEAVATVIADDRGATLSRRGSVPAPPNEDGRSPVGDAFATILVIVMALILISAYLQRRRAMYGPRHPGGRRHDPWGGFGGGWGGMGGFGGFGGGGGGGGGGGFGGFGGGRSGGGGASGGF